MEDNAGLKRETRQLKRLEILIDVIFAIVIWRIFMLIPRPTKEEWGFETIGAFLISNKEVILIVFIAVVIVIVYWLQNNTLFGNLERTDNKHTAISILQIFFLLMFLFVIRLGITFEGSLDAKVLESIAAAMVGITATMGWAYAMKNYRLLSKEITEEKANEIQIRIMAEPLTALVTIPCAFIGPFFWEMAWLLYPLFVYILTKRLKRK